MTNARIPRDGGRRDGKANPHKPFTVPEGWKPPSIAEQFAYFYRTHGHQYRYGYAAVVLLGLGFWGSSTYSKTHRPRSTVNER